ncbi:MAG: aminomethyl-transferring glycine dehydrogenase subunit GcvPB [Candidatus Eremiobacterota bacterium]
MLIFEKSVSGRKSFRLPEIDVPEELLSEHIPEHYLAKSGPSLPEVSEVDLIRHYTGLSRKSFGVDLGFYPLGSCTMKYNPKINEDISGLQGFSQIHPFQSEDTVQGAMEVIYELDKCLCAITGMSRFTLQPAAGAHGEFTGLLIAKAYFKSKGQKRSVVIIPDSSHGTNPASAAMCGFKTVQVKSDSRGCIDMEKLEEVLNEDTAVLMLTNPNTLGLFEEDILKITEMVHEAGALLYYDGANLNAILGICRPADLGFDIVHLNLHKTFSTPHGGGGPGAGPVGVTEKLVPYLPVPLVDMKDDRYYFNYNMPQSIGRVGTFYGNFSILLRAYAYILTYGREHIRKVGEMAVLNANYLMKKLSEDYYLPYKRTCKHEFVLSASEQKKYGVRALDIAKKLLDYGFHAPTIYFPLIVEEAIMIEPTETECRETLDSFIQVMKDIAKDAREKPDSFCHSPSTTPVGRLDEVSAARKPVLRWGG